MSTHDAVSKSYNGKCPKSIEEVTSTSPDLIHWHKGNYSLELSGGSRISRRGAWTSSGGVWTPEAVTFRKCSMSKQTL